MPKYTTFTREKIVDMSILNEPKYICTYGYKFLVSTKCYR